MTVKPSRRASAQKAPVSLHVDPPRPDRQLEERYPPRIGDPVVAAFMRRLARRVGRIAVAVAAFRASAGTVEIPEAVVQLLLAHLAELAQERLGGGFACAGGDRRIGALGDRRHEVAKAPVLVADELRATCAGEEAQTHLDSSSDAASVPPARPG